MVTCANTYHYAVAARNFVKAGRAGLSLVVTTLLVCVVKDVGVVVINVVASKGIGEELQE
jgi:hypothetical protein